VTAVVLVGGQDRRPVGSTTVTLRKQAIVVHLAAAASPGVAPLLVYITGDGGWPGDERLFDRMMPWGWPMAGFSAVDYIASINTPTGRLEPTQVASDFTAILDAATQSLKLPAGHPVVLVGFSRGASLAVSAATMPAFAWRLQGVLAIALGPDEVYVSQPVPGGGADRPLRPYEALPKISNLGVAVIQSTRDEILSADRARKQFGLDTALRRFRAIDARDHSFGGSLDALAAEMKASVDWLVTRSRTAR
jgi:pimeloyl-ACP methyl ester carboxylesterase